MPCERSLKGERDELLNGFRLKDLQGESDMMNSRIVIGAALLTFLANMSGYGGSLVGHWTFDSDGTSDSSGNSYNGALNGDAARTTNTAALGAGSLVLDGVGDYLQLPRGDLANSGDLIRKWKTASNEYFNSNGTLSIWVKLANATPPAHWGFVALDQPNQSDWGTDNCYPFTDGRAHLGIFRVGRLSNINLSPSVNRDQWHMVTITSDPTNGWRLYQNGEMVFSTNQGTFGVDCYLGFTVGVNYSDYLDGHVDDVAIFNAGLSSNDVSTIYSMGSTMSLGCNAGHVVALLDFYKSAGHKTNVNGRLWYYRPDSLTGEIARVQVDGQFFHLRLGVDGSGLTTRPMREALIMSIR